MDGDNAFRRWKKDRKKLTSSLFVPSPTAITGNISTFTIYLTAFLHSIAYGTSTTGTTAPTASGEQVILLTSVIILLLISHKQTQTTGASEPGVDSAQPVPLSSLNIQV